MRPTSLSSFFDELTKIGEDLMTPAVVAESNTVDGPPAAPWTRRRGYRKLSRTIEGEGAAINKQAGIFSRFASSYRTAKTHASKAKKAVDDAALKTFVAMPHPVQKALTDPRLMDPSDQSTGIATKSIFRMFGG